MTELQKDVVYAIFLGVGIISFIMTVLSFMMSSWAFFPGFLLIVMSVIICKKLDE